MSNTIIINSSNVSNSFTNNQFTYKLINGNFNIPYGSKICVSSIQIPYSIFNITNIYKNNKFVLSWTSGNAITYYDINLPDGFYSITDINQYIQLFCIENGFYLVDSSGNNVYYIQMEYNITYYSVQILLFQVPTSLPVGYTQPANFAGYPTIAQTPVLRILNNNFTKIIGYNPGDYGFLSNTSINSAFSPTGSPVNSLILKCNLVDNRVSNQSDIVDSFSISNVSFGSNIIYEPSFEKKVKIKSGYYSEMNFTIVDQDLNTVFFRDPNVLITMLLTLPD